MNIRIVTDTKRAFLPLLRLGDEQDSMIDRYLDRGTLFVLYDDDPCGVCVVTDEGDGVFEIKNLAVAPAHQRRGYGSALIAHVLAHYRGQGRVMQLGTGEVPSILSFYRRCGFQNSHRIVNFFTDHYDHPIIEDGIQLVDMVYLQQSL